MTSKGLVPTAAVAARLGTPEATLRYWRHVGYGPPAYKIGRLVRYDLEEVEQWLACQRDERHPA